MGTTTTVAASATSSSAMRQADLSRWSGSPRAIAGNESIREKLRSSASNHREYRIGVHSATECALLRDRYASNVARLPELPAAATVLLPMKNDSTRPIALSANTMSNLLARRLPR